ncbi:MAG TPA: hypothetical protein DHW82_05240 [Spirochaetia bacterium]|nr:MAG: hypothetical protein A2Y41_05295 [Spirochaetes bacterium GWB1_36_13]HCL56396.1 hypothetical protein [Spirochaetia bacterium]
MMSRKPFIKIIDFILFFLFILAALSGFFLFTKENFELNCRLIVFLFIIFILFVLMIYLIRIRFKLKADFSKIMKIVHTYSYFVKQNEKTDRSLQFYFSESFAIYRLFYSIFNNMETLAEDIGVQKEVLRKEISDLNEELEKLINSIQTGIAILDLEDEKIVYSNRIFEEIYSKVKLDIKDLLLNLESENGSIIRVDDEKIYRSKISFLLPGKFMIELTDVSKEEKIIYYLKKAEEFQKSLLTNLSHELRTPLTPIISLSQVLLNDSELSKENLEICRMILIGGEKLLFNINNLLFYTQFISEQDKKYSFMRESLTPVVEKTLNRSFHQAEIEKKNLAVIFEPLEEKIFYNPDLVISMVDNAFSNALKFSPDHGTIRIYFDTSSDQELKLILENQFEIHYTEEHKKIILNPFVQYDLTETRKYGGLGLGLSIIKNGCQKINLDWHIEFENQTFRIVFIFKKEDEK